MMPSKTAALMLLAVALAAACGDRGGGEFLAPDGLLPGLSSGGKTGRSGAPGAGLCSDCHDSPDGQAPTVTLSGPTSLAPGATGTYALTIVPAAGSNQRQGGLNVAVPGGGTLAAGAGTQRQNGEITHSNPQQGSGTLSWEFGWTAPASSGTYTMYGVGLSTDGDGKPGDEEGTAQLAITVEGAQNQPPQADSKSASTDIDTPVTITMSGSDEETCDLEFAILDGPANGSLGSISDRTCGGGGPFNDQAEVVYTPDPGFSGSDQFRYQVTDGDGQSSDAAVSITVVGGAQNQAPTADAKNIGTDFGAPVTITLSGSDAETCDLDFSIVAAPSNGSLGSITDLSCSGSGPYTDEADVTYTPDPSFSGSDQFTYQVADADQATDQAIVTVTVSEGDVVDYELVRIRAKADAGGNVKIDFVVRNNRNRELGSVFAELYVGQPNAGEPDTDSSPVCTMAVSDEPGRGATSYAFDPAGGCPYTLDAAEQLPADYVVAVRLADDSPDLAMATITVRKVWRLLNLLEQISDPNGGPSK